MKIIRNNIIPFRGFLAINLFEVLFVRGDEKVNAFTINHEKIHTVQMKEMLYILFYVWYFIEWIVRLCINYKTAYRNISFEQEAYRNQADLSYLEKRKRFGFWKHK